MLTCLEILATRLNGTTNLVLLFFLLLYMLQCVSMSTSTKIQETGREFDGLRSDGIFHNWEVSHLCRTSKGSKVGVEPSFIGES